MGGNALNVDVQRINKSTYNIIKDKITTLFKDKLIIQFLYNIDNKESFGDLDVLCQCVNEHDNVLDILKSLYTSIDIYKNGSIISFAYEYENQYYQIDLIKTSNFPMSTFYLSYGVVGAIIGRMTNKQNVKYSETGLSLYIRGKMLKLYDNYEYTDNNVYRTIKLTTDPIVICDFLNLNYDIWHRGFATNNDLFEWICSSNIYSQHMFENINLHGKCQQYLDFIDYSNDRISINHNEEFDIIAVEYFNIKDTIINAIEDIHKEIDRKKKFNGDMIIKQGLVGKNIGNCIKYIKNKIVESGYSDFNIWLDEHDESNIMDQCLTMINEFKTQN